MKKYNPDTMTAREAVLWTKRIWKWLAENPEGSKESYVTATGDEELFSCDSVCPACHIGRQERRKVSEFLWAKSIEATMPTVCTFCPVWRGSNKCIHGGVGKGEYDRWQLAKHDYDHPAVVSAAKDIVRRCDVELRDWSEPTSAVSWLLAEGLINEDEAETFEDIYGHP